MPNGTSTQQSQYDLFSPAFLANPHRIYTQLRAETPVCWSEQLQGWLITRYADVRTVLYDPQFIATSISDIAIELPAELQSRLQTINDHIRRWVVAQDPPEHTRLRRLLNTGFKPRLIENLAPRIQAISDELLDAVQEQDRMELVADFAYPLPVMVIGEMLGIPAHDRTLLRDWIHDILMFAQRGPTGDPEAINAMHRAIVEMRDYMRGIVADHRRTPQDDIIGNLLAAEDEGARLDEEEIIANCLLLLLAGHETTMNLLGNGTLALLQHPEQCAQLQANPDLLPNAVEEFLRHESPLQIVLRLAREDLELHGQSISAGQRIIPMIGAANRDPAQFPDPDRLDLRRTPNAHLSFGHGIHFCLGAGLARLEARIAFATLLQRCPGLTLATDTPAWRETLTVRGLATLPVTFAAGEPRRRQLAVGMSVQSVAADDAAGCPFH